MGFYTVSSDKKSGDGLAITEWNDLSNSVAGNSGLTLARASADRIGIGTPDPQSKLHVTGKVDVHHVGVNGGQNRFTGLLDSADNRGQFVLSSSYSDLVIASSQVNNNHGSTLTFASYNPKDAEEHRKWVINQGNWGNRKQFLDFGYADRTEKNPHLNINSTDTVFTLDGINKRVGIGTANPSTKLEVSGDVKATHFIGDGSQLTNLSVGATGLNIATESGSKVGIGTPDPQSKLHVTGKVDVHHVGVNGGQNRFTGLLDSADNRGQFVLSSSYSDLVIASSQVNETHGSTLTFASYNPKDAEEHRKWVINQGNWGNRKQFLDFGYADRTEKNPHLNINGTDTTLTLDGINKRVGIGTSSPSAKLEVSGNTKISGNVDVSGDVKVSGSLHVNNLPYGDKANVQWDGADGRFWQDNSSRRHKENIIPLEDEFLKILEVAPKTYTRPGRPSEWEIGYIAEELHELGLNSLVYYEKDGRPHAINYTKICMYLVEVVKKISRKVDGLNV